MRRELDSKENSIDAVLAEYMRRIDRGESVDRESLIAAHPALAAELRQYFSQAEAVDHFADRATADFAHAATPRSGLEVRCPSCHAPMEVAVDTALTDLTCAVCGSHFSLVNQNKSTWMAPSLTTMGRFELVERLGVGGFGSVWKARDKELDRTVAIKIPRQSAMTAEEQEKFFREARAAAQLRHPSIVSVHEVGRDGDSVYIVSDFVRGVTLGDWLTGQQLTSREAAELCAKIADALHHAHERGVVHRDLKPANIMIDGDGEPHLMDFGLARREVGEVTVTVDGQVLGTPAYMSPEQAQGEAHTADRRSDVYSLGVILFQLLTGELPFRGNARMIMHQVINDEPPSPRKLNANIKRDLETITLKCLEKSPDRRYHTAMEFADELRRFLAGEAIIASPPGTLGKTWRWAKRKPLIAGLMGTLALSAAAIGITLFISFYYVSAALKQEQASRVETQRERDLARRHLYAAHMLLVDEAWQESNIPEMRALLSRHIPTDDSFEDIRGFEWFYYHRLCNQQRQEWDRKAGRPALAQFTPDGALCIIGREDGQIDVYSLGEQQPRLVIGTDEESLNSFCISPKGDVLYAGYKGQTLKKWRISDGELLAVVRPESADAEWFTLDVAISPDGNSLAMCVLENSGPTIQLFDTTTHELITRLSGTADEYFDGLSFSPNSNLLAAACWDGTIRIFDLTDGSEAKKIEAHNSSTREVAFSIDGQLLASAGSDGKVVLWNPKSGERVATIFEIKGSLNGLGFSPDGSLLAASGHDGRIYVWSLNEQKEIASIKAHGDSVVSLSFHPNSQILVSASVDRKVKVWDLSRYRGERRQLPLHDFHGSFAAGNVVYSQKTGFIAVGRIDKKIDLWKANSGRYHGTISTFDTHVATIAASITDAVLAISDHDGSIAVLRIPNGENMWSRREAGSKVKCLTFSPTGKLLVVGDEHGVITWLSVADGSVVGKLLTAGSSGDVVENNLGEDQDTVEIECESYPVQSMAFSPGGELLAAACGPIVKVWKIPDRGHFGTEIVAKPDWILERGDWESPYNQGFTCVSFSPTGTLLAGGSIDGSVELWRVPVFKYIGSLDHYSKSSVVNLAWHPTVSEIAVRYGRDKVMIWDTVTRELRCRLSVFADDSHGLSGEGISFNKDGSLLAVGAPTGAVVWSGVDSTRE